VRQGIAAEAAEIAPARRRVYFQNPVYKLGYIQASAPGFLSRIVLRWTIGRLQIVHGIDPR
jgi:hypothetical protein